LTSEDQNFPTVDSTVQYFTSTVTRAAAQCNPHLSTVPCRTPVSWVTEECSDAIPSPCRALTKFRAYRRWTI
jgi:hypothetical protein